MYIGITEGDGKHSGLKEFLEVKSMNNRARRVRRELVVKFVITDRVKLLW